MTAQTQTNDTDIAQVLEENKALKARLAQLEKTNDVLMAQVEKTTDRQGDAFAMFQQALQLEQLSLESKKRNQQMQREKAAAEQANAAKSHFLAIMSHELRTPMNAIIGYSDMLYEEAEEVGSEWLDDLRNIRIAAQQLLSLIGDILDYSKIEAGKMLVTPETIDLKELLNEIQVTTYALASKENNQFVLNYPENIPLLHTDLTKLRQILLNLLSNACKFTHNGEVCLEVSPQCEDQKPQVVFKIIDNGIGIEEHQLKHIFQPFTQADQSFTRSYDGTGLGLALSKQLTDILRGSIKACSQVGKGSCFTVSIPHYRLEQTQNT